MFFQQIHMSLEVSQSIFQITGKRGKKEFEFRNKTQFSIKIYLHIKNNNLNIILIDN
jgi:hypothetical protein